MAPKGGDGADKKKKRSKATGTEPLFSQSTYLTKIHKACHKELTISQAAVGELNRVVDHVTSLLLGASKEILMYTKGETLNQKVMESAGSVVFSGNLKRRALRRSKGSVACFGSSAAMPPSS